MFTWLASKIDTNPPIKKFNNVILPYLQDVLYFIHNKAKFAVML